MELDKLNLAYWEDIKDKVQPFDLIAFRGGEVVSDIISLLEKNELGVGDFTHVGMVVTSDILTHYYKDKKIELTADEVADDDDGVDNVTSITTRRKLRVKEGEIYVFESTMSHGIIGLIQEVPDVTTGKGCFGVQLRNLKKVIPAYITSQKTKVAWCPLLNNPYNVVNNRKLLAKTFTEFFNSYEGRSYELDPIALLSSMYPVLRPLRYCRDMICKKIIKTMRKFGIEVLSEGPAGWQFCSELVANVYKEIGILPPDIDPSNVIPVDFFSADYSSKKKKGRMQGLVASPIYVRDWSDAGEEAVVYDINE